MENNNFETLKSETSNLIKEQINYNQDIVLKYIKSMLSKFNSNITVRKNLSINSFEMILLNSASIKDFKEYLNRLNPNKSYEVYTKESLRMDYDFNEEFKNDDMEEYEVYKKFLDLNIKLNDNLYIIEYPENQ